MSRKFNYELPYHHDHDHQGGADTKQETIRPGLWQCSICTYDNDESMTSCDICDVQRPLPNIGTSKSSKIVEEKTKFGGASNLARAIFQSLPQQIPKEVVLFPKQGDSFLTDGSSFYSFENVRGEFHEVHINFSTQNHPHLTHRC